MIAEGSLVWWLNHKGASMNRFHETWMPSLPARLLLVGALVILMLLIGLAVFRPAEPHTAAALAPEYVTFGQRAAIEGGEDLLLLSGSDAAYLYLPMIKK